MWPVCSVAATEVVSVWDKRREVVAAIGMEVGQWERKSWVGRLPEDGTFIEGLVVHTIGRQVTRVGDTGDAAYQKVDLRA